MLRVDSTTSPHHEAVISLTGDFTDEFIPCVEHALSAARAEGASIALHLGRVLLVDRGAMCYLNSLRQQDVTLRECPAYVVRWMDQERSDCG